ncbi:TylF/MycF/NovP-related O-methyltransferase [Leptolyngbya sp. DQ-M1]|uniref:TylF/MycF/NovP-related O-methyltransferase n=1 Tax=Leptolyngbya sp. DQ-M1 TaxID=2933920 RepID=UPI0032994C48
MSSSLTVELPIMLLSAFSLEQVKPYTLCTPDRLENLATLCHYLNAHAIPGDFVECGTYKGGSAAILSKFLAQRHLWLYDSFEGMPTTTEKDGEDAKRWIGECVATIADVKAVLSAVGTSESSYTIKPGWFETTFEQELPQQIALLHCDADWYDSVTLVLETFYPRLAIGGCVVLDDFGHWEGCREAFYDFCNRQGEKPLLERIGTDQAFWIKGRSNNRSPIPQVNHSGNQSFETLQALEQKLQTLQLELEQARSTITAMETSKFWKLRSLWFRLKQLV